MVDKRRCALTPKMINALIFFTQKQFYTWNYEWSPLRQMPQLILKSDDDDIDENLLDNDDDEADL